MQSKCLLSLFSLSCTHQGKDKPIGFHFHIKRKDEQKNHGSREINKTQTQKCISENEYRESTRVKARRLERREVMIGGMNSWSPLEVQVHDVGKKPRDGCDGVSEWSKGNSQLKGKEKHKTGHVFPSISSSLITSSAPIGVVVFFCLLIFFAFWHSQSTLASDTLEDWQFITTHTCHFHPLILREKIYYNQNKPRLQ